MDCMRVTGGACLSGTVWISGAKNAVLPLMTVSLMTDQPVILERVPQLEDVKTMALLLSSLGTSVVQLSESKFSLSTENLKNSTAVYDIVRKMRASILVLGPLLARHGYAEVSLPGGCAIGARPVNLHLEALQSLGVQFNIQNGYVYGKAPQNGLVGGQYTFPKVSVTGTMNMLLAACLAKGESCILNAAKEPEVDDLVDCLVKMGAIIEGRGTSRLSIQGVSSLRGVQHAVLPDRIEMGTYMIAAAMTKGNLLLKNGNIRLLESLVSVLEGAGVSIQIFSNDDVRVSMQQPIAPFYVHTDPYPAFPTDLQAQIVAMACIATGESKITENIFENRFMHVLELTRMGANIQTDGRTVTVRGVSELSGAPVMATDLRASVGLVLAGLVAKGITVVRRIYHLDRGYENLENKLGQCGALIERVRIEQIDMTHIHEESISPEVA